MKTQDHAPAARFEQFALMGIIMAAVVAFRRCVCVCVCALHLTRDCAKGVRQQDGCTPCTNTDTEKFVFTCCMVQDLSSAVTGSTINSRLKKKNRMTSNVITKDYHFSLIIFPYLYNIDLNGIFISAASFVKFGYPLKCPLS